MPKITPAPKPVTPASSLLLVGCGKMGGALLKGWLQEGSAKITVIDPSSAPPELAGGAVDWHQNAEQLGLGTFDAILLAVKPQQMAATLPAYARFKDSLFISIAAGLTIRRIAEYLGSETPDVFSIVRTMPNLPASIGQGITGCVANNRVNPAQRAVADTLLRAVGETVWLDSESLIDALTALSGSGPAYHFALIETMADAGEKLGLPAPLAMQLARQTMIGSGALLAQSGESAAVLRQAVTSPGGTTEAALNHLLTEDGLPALMLRAMHAAATQAKKLAEERYSV